VPIDIALVCSVGWCVFLWYHLVWAYC